MTDALENQSQDNLEASLAQVQNLLAKMRLVEELVHKQGGPRQDLVENLVHKQNLSELQRKIEELHPADIAYILEALPLDERRLVWSLVSSENDGEILLEVSDSVRESLIQTMVKAECWPRRIAGHRRSHRHCGRSATQCDLRTADYARFVKARPQSTQAYL